MTTIEEILQGNDKGLKLALFHFSIDEPDINILLKFNIWSRYFFPQYFDKEDAPFHREIDSYNLQAYKGSINSFVDIAFRGSGKTSRTKLFIAFCIANDKNHWRRYIKVLTKDMTNSKQIVTDIYNMFVDQRFKQYYPTIFQKTDAKREETMSSFTTFQGVKLYADTVGTEQRGQLQDSSRPDLIWFEDFETRKTLRSAVETHSIWENMEEARTGLSQNGASIYTCNYISERGNVHRLVQKKGIKNIVLITPIEYQGTPAWSVYTREQLGQIRREADDYEGEYLCQPSAGKDVMFDRSRLELQTPKMPLKVSAGFKIYGEFDPSHRYGSGHDVAGGVGLDSSTSVIIDFSTMPYEVVGVFHNSNIAPEAFGDEIERELDFFGKPICAIENNKYDQVVLRAKQLGVNLYQKQGKLTKINFTPSTEYGWNTNSATKPKMMFDLVKATDDGHLLLNDEDLINEAKSYSRDDLMDREIDVRLSTRHFDLLTACAIAYQMKDFADVRKEIIRPIIRQSNKKSGRNVAL